MSARLEWPIVYLLGLEQNRLPDWHVLETEEGEPLDPDRDNGSLEEERRICFVGVTRAEHRLVVGYVHKYRRGAIEPSIFLEDIREGLNSTAEEKC